MNNVISRLELYYEESGLMEINSEGEGKGTEAVIYIPVHELSLIHIFNYQAKIATDLAEKESCVIVGRCVNYVFKDRPNTLRVFVHAPWEFRVEKSREKISGSDEEIEKFLRRDDKRKQDYYRKFAGGDWSDATNYDLCLNAGKLGFEKCVDAILAQMNVMGIK